MIDFGFSVNEMMDECLPLMLLRVGDYHGKILINNINHFIFVYACLVFEKPLSF